MSVRRWTFAVLGGVSVLGAVAAAVLTLALWRTNPPAEPPSTAPPTTAPVPADGTSAPGPQERAVSACMEKEGFDWSLAIGKKIADAELADPGAGHAAGAAAIGLAPERFEVYLETLTGTPDQRQGLAEADFCGALGWDLAAAQTRRPDYTDPDIANITAIQLQCLSERGVTAVAGDDWLIIYGGIGEGTQGAAEALGRPTERVQAYMLANWGIGAENGQFSDPEGSWRDWGCSGYLNQVGIAAQ
ncbi:hypothetical protein HQQ81_06840 [Microbacteriaceae bacterium VKM Ac-2854]|nr:hypothetical protein [Microbacteriaceae bacterium VKM Ac-2854]